MKSDARLIKYIQHSRQRRAYLSCKTYPLTFTARKSSCRTWKRKVRKSYAFEKIKSVVYLLCNSLCNKLFTLRKPCCLWKFKRFTDWHITVFAYIHTADCNGKAFGRQSFSSAGITRHRWHIALYLSLYPWALCFTETPFKVVYDTLEFSLIYPRTVFVSAVYCYLFSLCSVKYDIHYFFGQVFYRCIKGKIIFFRKRFKIHRGDSTSFHCPAASLYRALTYRFIIVGYYAVNVYLHEHAEACAFFTCAVRIVERKHSRTKLVYAHSMLRTGIILWEKYILSSADCRYSQTSRKLWGCFNGIRKSWTYFRLDNKSVNDYLYIMLFIFFGLYGFGKVIYYPVNSDTHKTALWCGFKLLLMLTLFWAYNRRKYLYFRTLRKLHKLIDYLIDSLLFYLPAADRTVWNTYTSIQKSQIVIYFRYSSDCWTRIFWGSFLVYGYCGRKPVYAVNVRLVHLSQKHPCIRWKRLYISSLSLRIKRIECKILWTFVDDNQIEEVRW